MGKMSRDKGARFERKLAEIFREHGYPARRTCQRAGKGTDCPDVSGLPGIHVEAKHCERMQLYDWMAQAVRDSDANISNNVPAVFHKANKRDTLVTMRLDDWMKLFDELQRYRAAEF